MKYSITYTPPHGSLQGERCAWTLGLGVLYTFDTYEQAHAKSLHIFGPTRGSTYMDFLVRVDSERVGQKLMEKNMEKLTGQPYLTFMEKLSTGNRS